MGEIPFCLFTPSENGKKIVWEITSRCNMHCKHCCSSAAPEVCFLEEFISSNQSLFKQKIDEMISSGIREFYISGGEPFFIKNIFKVLKYIKGSNKNVKISIATNGYLLNESFIKKLFQIKVNLLHISLDGHSAEIHNFLREGNFFNKILENIKLTVKYCIPLRVGCIIWRQNESFLEDMVKLCINLNVKELRFSWLIKVGRFKENPQLFPERKWESITNKIEKLKRKYKDKIKISMHRTSKIRSGQSPQICPGGDKLFFLNPKGELSVCSWIAKIDPNFLTKKTLKETKFGDLTKEKEILDFRKILEERRKRNLAGCPFIDKGNKNHYL